METYRLYLIPRDGSSPERVIISADLPEEVQRDYGTAEDILEIEGDAMSFPCNRPLIHFT